MVREHPTIASHASRARLAVLAACLLLPGVAGALDGRIDYLATQQQGRTAGGEYTTSSHRLDESLDQYDRLAKRLFLRTGYRYLDERYESRTDSLSTGARHVHAQPDAVPHLPRPRPARRPAGQRFPSHLHRRRTEPARRPPRLERLDPGGHRSLPSAGPLRGQLDRTPRHRRRQAGEPGAEPGRLAHRRLAIGGRVHAHGLAPRQRREDDRRAHDPGQLRTALPGRHALAGRPRPRLGRGPHEPLRGEGPGRDGRRTVPADAAGHRLRPGRLPGDPRSAGAAADAVARPRRPRPGHADEPGHRRRRPAGARIRRRLPQHPRRLREHADDRGGHALRRPGRELPPVPDLAHLRERRPRREHVASRSGRRFHRGLHGEDRRPAGLGVRFRDAARQPSLEVRGREERSGRARAVRDRARALRPGDERAAWSPTTCSGATSSTAAPTTTCCRTSR